MRYVQRALPLRDLDVPLRPSLAPHLAARLYYRLRHGLVYSRPYFDGWVVEAAAYLFKDAIPLERMKRDFDVHHRAGLPFTVATHYWELSDERRRDKLRRLLDHIASRPGTRFVSLREVFA
jgi:hypothetical protein